MVNACLDPCDPRWRDRRPLADHHRRRSTFVTSTRPAPEGVSIRPAGERDLPALAAVYRHADPDVAHLPGGSPEAADLDAHACDDLRAMARDPRAVWLAEAGGSAIGVAAAVVRGRHWHLAYLFVEPAWQGKGVGAALLAACHAAGAGAGCTVFSTEPSSDARGMALYLRSGMTPRLPALVLDANAPRFPAPDWQDGLEAIPVTADDAHLLATVGDVDAAVRGARRPEDHLRWLADGGSLQLLMDRARGVPAGYVVVRPDHGLWRLGPVAAMDPAIVPAVLARAMAAAGRIGAEGRRWRICVPGENPAAIAPALEAGFLPVDLAPMLANRAVGLWDRYLFSDLDFL